MLTRQGWLVSGGAVALIAAGRILGVLELFVIGAATGALVIAALVVVYLSRLRLAVARQVTPPRVYAGTPSRVELSIRNIAEGCTTGDENSLNRSYRVRTRTGQVERETTLTVQIVPVYQGSWTGTAKVLACTDVAGFWKRRAAERGATRRSVTSSTMLNTYFDTAALRPRG